MIATEQPIAAADWVDEHGDYLLKFAWSRVRNRETAEDLVQETFVAAIRAYAAFSGKSSLRTWLTGILKNKIVDHFRSNSKFSLETGTDEIPLYFGRNDHWIQPPGKWSVNDPSMVLREKELRQVLQSCLAALPDGLAQAFVLRDIEDLEADEVCRLLSMTAGSLYTALHRARFRIRRCVELNWFENEEAR